ncbi:circularly permutated Ras protein 1-like isoform X2 [Cololabis saira]|uniref:circularly permutated Ras protein 1-like isoform X2 n=1 Tax=Cololabis saira TaxID=129043 RepID=UPI002AD47433|nr:circularly permutated Ras protein 1-like isoform X2 [Cololabis saira]
MEFACGFVYVPPSLSEKNSQQSNAFKRSALLPPVNWSRPRSPPPPPPPPPPLPTQSAKAKVKQPPAPFPKTALLPPHMRPAAGSLSPSHKHPAALCSSDDRTFICNQSKKESDLNTRPRETPEGSDGEVKLPADTHIRSTPAPPLPPRPSFMTWMPEYLELIPSSSSSSSSPVASPRVPSPTNKGSADKGPLPGNPNVVLVSLGKLLSEERVQPTQGEPTSCSQCRSVLDTCYGNVVNACYFCESLDSTSSPSVRRPLNGLQDSIFPLKSEKGPLCAADALLLLCIDVSGSMSITSQVLEGGRIVHKSRLQFVQEAVLQCIQELGDQQCNTRVGLITFNHQVTVHGYENAPSHLLSDAELIESDYLKAAGVSLPSTPPLSQTKDCLQRQVLGLSANGATALGPAALLAIAMASRQSGSKVIICTDGKANTELGNLEEEDNDARTLLSSTIFYQELGEYAADQGVTVSVMSIEGTDCRLDELGRLADRTGGKVVIASPSRLHAEFEHIIQNRTIATHCTVTLLLPKSLHVKGEKEAGHKGTREVGNVNPDTEITFQFGASEENTEVPAPAPGSRVTIQLQIRYKRRNGQMMLRVLTADLEVTNDSSTRHRPAPLWPSEAASSTP